MKLRGLPLDIRPGPVDLTVSPAPCPLLQPCLHCKLYNRVYFICVKSHITCMDCYLPDTSANKLTRPQYESYCKPCNLKVTLHRIEVPLPLLKALSFICGCGFTGRLCEIKKHVKSDDFSMGCSLLAQSVPPASDQFDVVLAKLQLELQEVANDYQAQLLVIKEKFQHSFGNKVENSAPNTTVFSKKQTDAAILNIGLLNRRLKVLLSETTLLRKRSVKITPRVQDEFGRVLMDIRKNVLENEYPIRPKEQEEAKRKD